MTVIVDTLETGWIDEDLKLWFRVNQLIEIYYNQYNIIELIHVGKYGHSVIIVYEEPKNTVEDEGKP